MSILVGFDTPHAFFEIFLKIWSKSGPKKTPWSENQKKYKKVYWKKNVRNPISGKVKKNEIGFV